MANELKSNQPTGLTLYTTIQRADGQYWRTDTSVFEAYNAANWAKYIILFTETTGTGRYLATFPTGINTAGIYSLDVRRQITAGATAQAITDPNVAGGDLAWDGAAEILPARAADLATVAGYVDTEVAAIKAKTDLIPAAPASETTLGAVKTKTDNLPAAPAAVGDIPTAAAIWGALTSALTAAGSVGKRIADFLTGDAYARLGAPAGASVSADIAVVAGTIPTAEEIADAEGARIIEGTYTRDDVERAALAHAVGSEVRNFDGTYGLKDTTGTKERARATIDPVTGERIVSARDLS